MIRATFLVPLLLSVPIHAQVENARSSTVDFVQRFYAWYAPFAQSEHKSPAFELAIKRNAALFSVELRSALMSDAAAQSKVSGNIVGIDFDPFLNSQDPAGRYEIGEVVEQGNRCLCHLHAVIDGNKQTRPTVIAEVEQQSGNWVFVNFRYPNKGGDLLSTLRSLRESRRKKPGK